MDPNTAAANIGNAMARGLLIGFANFMRLCWPYIIGLLVLTVAVRRLNNQTRDAHSRRK